MAPRPDPSELEWIAEQLEDTELLSLSDLDPALLADVKVQTLNLGGRQRQIQAQLNLIHTLEQVWQVLTAYDQLADFIPNLARSQRLPHPEGGIRIEQVGVQNALFLKFAARVVLDMEETFPHTIRFQMVEGDFKDFSGAWNLEPWQHPKGVGTALIYTLNIWPKRTMPLMAIERRLRRDLSCNLIAIQQYLNKLHPSL